MKKKFNHITDAELDKLFRDAAEGYRPPAAPQGAWEDFLNSSQDKAAAEKEFAESVMYSSKKKALHFLLTRRWQIAAGLLLIAGSFWLFKNNPDNNTPPAHTSNKVQEPVKSLADKKKPENTIPVSPYLRDNTTFAQKNTFPETKAWQKPAAVSHISASLQAVSGMPVAVSNSINTTGWPDGNNTIQHKILSDSSYNTLTRQKQNKPMLGQANPANENRRPDYTLLPKQQEQYASGRRYGSNSKWQLGVVSGTNLSMVAGNISSQPGINAGVTVQRKLGNSRFSVESGVIYESMNYSVDNKDFNPGGKPVSSRVSNIEGTCSMIDVPVNVRYDIIESKKGKAFVSTGVSPTIMVKQSYIYQLERDSGPVQINRDVSGDGKNVYAVANISIGYEQKWDRTSVQIAPYLKIPTGEIGYGNLSLGGIGTQVSIKRDL
ncbi:MAG: outer membrane beta-barrel protein [Niabella sp.]